MRLTKRQILGLLLSFLLLFITLAPRTQSDFYLHEKQRLSVGESIDILLNLPPLFLNSISVSVKEGEKLLFWKENKGKVEHRLSYETAPVLMKPGKVQLELKLFNLIPFKKISVDVMPNVYLIPGGHSIGVLLRTDGVMVVGFSPVIDDNEAAYFPAKEAGIEVGDLIVKVNGKEISTDDQVKEMVASWKPENGNITFIVKRNNVLQERKVYPKYCKDTSSYRIGLFIRDNAGGVGTLTFFDPITKKYGALGHVITDNEKNQPLKIRQGKILTASIEDIQKAKRGMPGEKVGMFIEGNELGNIEKNETCGIYGITNKNILNPLYPEALPIAYSNQIRTGKAEILTVLKGQEICKYQIEIERIVTGRQDNKNMIIRITDESLKSITGGIIQGMSGSPIIQNGKIVGAVTHVFVNDPQRGYAVFIENMLFEANILTQKEKTLGLNSQGFFV